MTNGEQVSANILQRENMPKPLDVGDGEGVTGAGGQTASWCSRWGVPFPQDEATAAANLLVWLAKTRLMSVVNASLALGDAVADWAYNNGEPVAIRALEHVLGTNADGTIGPLDQAALTQHAADLNAFVRDIAKARVAFIGDSARTGSITPKFVSGEINRALLFL